jgi:adenylate kinase
VYALILGPPGAGKGTQGKILADRLEVPKISTGDLLREAVQTGSAVGRRAQGYMDRGELVPDDVILRLVEDQLDSGRATDGAVFDGFPRTIEQAEAVDRLLNSRGFRLSHVLLFDVSEEEIERRLLQRGAVEGRSDDDLPTIRRRLAVYQQSTAPLVAYYAQRGTVHRVPGTGTVEEIAMQVRRVVGR